MIQRQPRQLGETPVRIERARNSFTAWRLACVIATGQTPVQLTSPLDYIIDKSQSDPSNILFPTPHTHALADTPTAVPLEQNYNPILNRYPELLSRCDACRYSKSYPLKAARLTSSCTQPQHLMEALPPKLQPRPCWLVFYCAKHTEQFRLILAVSKVHKELSPLLGGLGWRDAVGQLSPEAGRGAWKIPQKGLSCATSECRFHNAIKLQPHQWINPLIRSKPSGSCESNKPPTPEP